jgi:hypothetical protein
MAAGNLPQCMVQSLKGTQQLNPGLKMPYNRPVTYINAAGQSVELVASEERAWLLFKHTGCGEQQHHKHCTPHALGDAADLLCPFCMYGSCEWEAAGKGSIVGNELSFMSLLMHWGTSSSWCHQVRHDWWPACIDFYNWQQGVYVQVDGASHWYGMRNASQAEVVARDLGCNSSAFWAGAAMVRAHEYDLQQPDALLAAIETAAADNAVVFTAGYRAIGWQHVILLQQQLQYCCSVYTDAYGNTVFARAEWLTGYTKAS